MWGKLIRTVVYLTYLSTHSALKGKTPDFMLCGKDPNYSKHTTIGTLVFVHEETCRQKLESKA